MLSPFRQAVETSVDMDSQRPKKDEEHQSRCVSHICELTTEKDDVDKVPEHGADDMQVKKEDVVTNDESEDMQEMEKVSDFVKASVPFETEEEALDLFSNSSSPHSESTRSVEEYQNNNDQYRNTIQLERQTQVPSSSSSHTDLQSNDSCSQHPEGSLDSGNTNQEVYTRPDNSVPIPPSTIDDNGSYSCEEADRLTTKSDESAEIMSEKQGFSWNEILLVQNLIERCLQQHLSKVIHILPSINAQQTLFSQDEIIYTLQAQAKVDPQFTHIVWQKLEEQNESFFRAYTIQSELREQIAAFNYLVRC